MPASPDAPLSAGGAYGGAVAIGSLSEIVAEFEGFILDQWGVLHDGTRPYPGAAECLRHLRAAGKRIVVLSNSGKREADNLRLMQRLGFDTGLIDGFVSAGEDARNALESRTEPFYAGLGRRCFAITRGGDRSLLEDIGLAFVETVEDADFLAVTGTDSPGRNVDDYAVELRAALAKSLPMVCANPDLARFTPQGLIEAPGVLARRYESLGGTVHYHGKPHPPIYRSCLTTLACPADRVLTIGDSMEHDVLGASRVGLRSALIPGGVHTLELEAAWGQLPSPERWRTFAANVPATPDYLLAAFNW